MSISMSAVMNIRFNQERVNDIDTHAHKETERQREKVRKG